MDVQFDFAWLTEEIIDILAPLEFFGVFDRYQYRDRVPDTMPLSPTFFMDALNNGHHRFLYMLIHANTDIWSLGEAYLRTEDLVGLEDMDHALFMVPGAGGATDCRSEGILKTLLIMPRGGCVGAVGPSSQFYVSPGNLFFQSFWQVMVDHPNQRVGDAYRQTLVDLIGNFPNDSFMWNTFMCMSIFGDPALFFLPATRDENSATAEAEPKIVADACPIPSTRPRKFPSPCPDLREHLGRRWWRFLIWAAGG